MDILVRLLTFAVPGGFLYFDLFAMFTNALNAVLLVQRPDRYKGRHFTVPGILAMAIIGGIGGSITRDVLLNEVPHSLTNPWSFILIGVAWILGLWLAWDKGQKYRETFHAFMASFSLPWYAVVGVEAGLQSGWPLLGAVFLGAVGPVSGRLLVDLASGVPTKLFAQGEWFIGTAILTSLCFFFLRVGEFADFGLSLGFVTASLLAAFIGFVFRLAALWYGWKEPMPKRIPVWLLEGQPKRTTLKEKMADNWEPEWIRPEK